MAQDDFNIINAPGAAFRADLNNQLLATVSNSSGATEPATTFAYQWWTDTTTGTLKQRNASNSAWIEKGQVATNFGTIVGEDSGTGVGEVPVLEDVGGGTPGLPAVDGSQLTGVGVASAPDPDFTAPVELRYWRAGGPLTHEALSVAAGSGHIVVGNGVSTSDTLGETWTPRTSPEANRWQSVATNGTTGAIAVSDNGTNRAIKSSDSGASWSVSSIQTELWYGITYGGPAGYVAFGIAAISYSTDGTSWAAATPPGNDSYLSGIWVNDLSLYVAVSINPENSSVITSADADTWAIRTTPSGELIDITYSGKLGLLIAVGLNGTIIKSVNAITWVTVYTGFASHLAAVVWADELAAFTAFSLDGSAIVSTDGVNWYEVRAPDSYEFMGMSWNGIRMVAVAFSGTHSVHLSQRISPMAGLDAGTEIGNVPVLVNDGSGGGALPAVSGQNLTDLPPSGGSLLPVDDTTALVQDPVDNTKRVRLDAGTVATGTTRVLTMPDADVVFSAFGAARVGDADAVALKTAQSLENVENTAISTWGGSAGITTVGTVTAGSWTADDIAVADGGTGVSAQTAYAVVCGGTTATGALQNVSGLGTATHVLTSNGAVALPTWQAPAEGGSLLPVDDTTALVQDPVDNTKRVRIDSGGVPTGVTAVVTITEDTDVTPVSAYGATLVDDVDSATARGTLGLGATDTVVHGDITGDSIQSLSGPPVNTQAGTTYTLALTDGGKQVDFTGAAAVALTVPTNASVAFPVGTLITVTQLGLGQVTLGGAGVTINNLDTATATEGQYAALVLKKTAADVWVSSGRMV